MYGAASETSLKIFDIIPNEAMRIAAGTFKTNPINRLNVLTNEPPLTLRRKDLLLRYFYPEPSISIDSQWTTRTLLHQQKLLEIDHQTEKCSRRV